MAAQAVVSVVLETIRNLLLEEVRFHRGVRDQVEEIKAELTRMQSFLKDADCCFCGELYEEEDERIRNQIAEVREAAYDIEDSIVEYVDAKVESTRRRNSRNLLKVIWGFFNQMVVTHRVGNQIVSINGKINGFTDRLRTYGIAASIRRGSDDGTAESSSCDNGGIGRNRKRELLRRAYSHEIDDDFIGLEEDIEVLAEQLVNEESDRAKVISIWGMGGLGKTTIARKLYVHDQVRRNFDDFAWTCVSQRWEKKDLLQGILIKLMPPEKREEIVVMRDEELVRQLHRVQVNRKCLVVLDDIWSTEAWDALKSAFPTFRTGSKILLTTRNKEVALHVSHGGFLYNPRFLHHEESWELLQKKAFSRRDRSGTFPLPTTLSNFYLFIYFKKIDFIFY